MCLLNALVLCSVAVVKQVYALCDAVPHVKCMCYVR